MLLFAASGTGAMESAVTNLAAPGDRVRLADTDLLIEVERDFTSYGDEVKFGGGKVIRDGMGQGQRTAGRSGRRRARLVLRRR